MSKHPRTLLFSRGLEFSDFAEIHGPRGFAGFVFAGTAPATGAATMFRFHAGLVPALFVPRERFAPPRRHQAQVGRGQNAGGGGVTEAAIRPPTSVCEQGTLSFEAFQYAG